MNPTDNMSEKICKNVGKNMPAIFLPAEQCVTCSVIEWNRRSLFYFNSSNVSAFSKIV